MSETNIIQRRDLNPLWLRAAKVMRHYEKASNCIAAVIGVDGDSVEYYSHPRAALFCSLCKRYNPSASQPAPHEHPCSDIHREAVHEARRLGGSYVYTCPVGFFFWTSPFFSGERFAGVLTSSGVLAADRQKILERIFSVCKGEVSRDEIEQYLEGIPQKSGEEIKALAQMMMLCAEQISCHGSCRNTSADISTDSAAASAIPVSSTAADDTSGGRQCPGRQPALMDQERALVASLRRGDGTEAQHIVRELLNNLDVMSNGNFDYFKLKAIELMVLLSRAEANSENNEELVEANNRYLKRIEDSRNAEEVTGNLCMFLQRMVGIMFSFHGIRHASALRKAERFIWENYTRKLSLKEIADVSGLSAPYFSTIFKDEMGENLSGYLNRLRVEKASTMLMETDSPINSISTACGFEDQSWFSKIFKSYTGCSPNKFREQGKGGPLLSNQDHKARQVQIQ